MDISRRSFIKWVIAGAASASPFGCSPAVHGGGKNIPEAKLGSESNKVCHDVRDGLLQSGFPPPSKSVDIVIVGGGSSGLAAAERCFGSDFLLLEKDAHMGGNAWSETWEGLDYCTGSAWMSFDNPEVVKLFQRWKLELPEIKGNDSAHWDGTWIKDFWNSDPDYPSYAQLPYPKSVQDDFRRFIRETKKIDRTKDADKLDAMTFQDLFKGYDGRVQQYWDYFGPSNWGAQTQDTSALIGLTAVHEWAPCKRNTYEGGLGMVTRKVFASFPDDKKKRCVTNAAVFAVRREGKRVNVSFMKDGKPETVSAKSVIMCAPKFIAKHLLNDLPEAQSAAMAKMRYAPYLVYNFCFDKVVWNLNYDNWAIGARHFTDFIPADYATHADGGDLSRKQVITVYAPKTEAARADLLDDEEVLAEAHAAGNELCGVFFPSWAEQLREVRVYRRGHPMPMSAPGSWSKLQKATPLDHAPVYFSHSDNSGTVSDLYEAALGAIKAAEKALTHV
ncbi:MAG: FAD-dependent oxidoreductase [Elusimicrobia bacterium]|nr:FAD-dependent oxidoreductase [Elusimicrobiota bacterium]